MNWSDRAIGAADGVGAVLDLGDFVAGSTTTTLTPGHLYKVRIAKSDAPDATTAQDYVDAMVFSGGIDLPASVTDEGDAYAVYFTAGPQANAIGGSTSTFPNVGYDIVDTTTNPVPAPTAGAGFFATALAWVKAHPLMALGVGVLGVAAFAGGRRSNPVKRALRF